MGSMHMNDIHLLNYASIYIYLCMQVQAYIGSFSEKCYSHALDHVSFS